MKKDNYSYDTQDPRDLDMLLDLPFSQLNKQGRKAKRKRLIKSSLNV